MYWFSRSCKGYYYFFKVTFWFLQIKSTKIDLFYNAPKGNPPYLSCLSSLEGVALLLSLDRKSKVKYFWFAHFFQDFYWKSQIFRIFLVYCYFQGFLGRLGNLRWIHLIKRKINSKEHKCQDGICYIYTMFLRLKILRHDFMGKTMYSKQEFLSTDQWQNSKSPQREKLSW